MFLNYKMNCNLGKTGTKFTVNSQVFVILFWFLVDISSSRQKQKIRGTRGMRFSKVFIPVLIFRPDVRLHLLSETMRVIDDNPGSASILLHPSVRS